MTETPIAGAIAWVLENGLLLYYVTLAGSILGFTLLEIMLPRSGVAAQRTRRWPVNVSLLVAAFLIQLSLPFSALVIAFWTEQRHIGLLNVLDLPPLAKVVLTFLLADWVAYLRHVLMHKVPLLWRLHRVHHADSALDVTTFGRFHPLEIIPEIAVMLAAVVALGLSPASLFLYELCSILFNVLAHANVGLPHAIDGALRTVVVTPDMHRLHHSRWQPQTDSNYGIVFAVWDRLGGTYSAKPDGPVAAMPVGLSDVPEPGASRLVTQLLLPFQPRPPPKSPAKPKHHQKSRRRSKA